MGNLDMCCGVKNDQELLAEENVHTADWQEEMIAEMVQILKVLYYEDFLFFYKFLVGYAARKRVAK